MKKIENEEMGNVCLEKGAKIDINDLHEKLGHPAEEMVKLTGNYMNLSIRGKMENCKNCAIGKMWQKNVEKGLKEKSSKLGYHFTLTSNYQNLPVLEDQNIGFWQWIDYAYEMQSILKTEKWC